MVACRRREHRPLADGSGLVTTAHFGSLDQLEQLLEMGMVDGIEISYARLDAMLT